MSTETPAITNPFSELVNALKAAFQHPSTPPSVSGSPMAMPATFAGEAAECSGFLLQVDLFIKMQPLQFTSKDTKVAFLISLLTGKALQWAKAIWNADNPIIHSYEQFTNHFAEVFSTTTGELATSDQLFRLQQGTSSVNHYTLHFRMLAVASGWNEKALLGAYRQGLNPDLRAAMALYDDSIGLEAFLQRTTKVASHPFPLLSLPRWLLVIQYQNPCKSTPLVYHAPNGTAGSLMDYAYTVDNLVISSVNAPSDPPRPVVSTLFTEVEISSLTLLPVTLHTSNVSLSVSALVDSGSSGNFISQECLQQLQLTPLPHRHVLTVKTIQGKPLGRGKIRHSSPITLQIGLFHSEDIRFLVLEDSTASIILGRPWLQQHHPELSWDPCDILHWSDYCNQHCLVKIPRPSADHLFLSSTRIESPDQDSAPEVPAEYMAFQDVFSKQAATQLPPHRPWDCAIDLLPGAQLPKGRVYPLSIPERQAMEEYISEALAQGFIQPSTSPAASSFFFVGKKDGGLRPCIDYRQLNSQVIQQPYPLPLVPAALEELRGAQVFTKLDLRSAYNLVRIRAGDEWKTAFVTPTGHYEYRVMPYGLSISPSVFQTFMNEVFREFLHRFVIVYIDILIYSRNMAEHRHHVQQVLHKLREFRLYLKLEKCEFHRPSVHFLGYIISAEGVQMDQGKVSAIQDWPQPLTVKELQRFLGFANFYRRFIKDYSTITAPLTSLLRGKPKSISWNPSAHEAFLHLKKIFSTAPLLHHPDPELPFTVEVDASTTGVGALSPAEQNYDVGNRELLAIKLALEEWRHWLEGSNHPFTIITDHKNLQYIREAKRLNPRQARWALFFTRFNYKITYRPGSKNISADALSRLHSPEQSVEPESIVPSNLIISPIVWEIDEDIRNATLQEAAPPECPEGKIYVPLALRQTLLDTAHRSPGSGHPGSQRTLSLVRSRYWWPSMRRDTIRYVQSCSVCAMSTSPRQLPTGKLVPLPIPQRPWSHIGVDFVTDLPAAEGNTCILVMVDRFSKMCKFFPLKGLPTAMETAETLFQQLFRHFGLPEEIVSDRGPQFISHLTCLLDITHRPTARQRERSRNSDVTSGHTVTRTNTAGTGSLPWAEYAQNSLRQDTTGLTPFQCVLGYQPPLFPWTEEPSNVPAVDHWFRESERVWDSAHIHLQRAVQQHKRFADVRRRPAPEFHPGDMVWLSTRDLRLRQPCRKLSPRYIGPFQILRRINEVTFQLQLPPRYRIHPTFHVSLLKPYHPSVTEPPGAEVEPPPPEILEPPSVYTVHEILGSRRWGGRLEYLVDWEGYGPEERSWVARDDILDPTLLTDFHRDHPDQPASRGRGRPRRRVGASGAAPGGGGSVRHSPQPPSSDTHPVAPPTRSQSPEF
ncbi:Transposon Tf2-11 polyprotein [Labeo rohita]|uniref:Gypsy retrotransposon integrase-like protein 1 n=1 Tax=Labeo rohita TaxID=84645 RepID=A0ABQ8MWK1_LABRO|nr:Transposon Tf2-11 polyprotein [Labeo rohita]